jgi:lysozyme
MLDPVGYPTIGWGSRYGLDGKEVTMKSKPLTLGECDVLLKRDVGYIADELHKYDLNQNQFDALTSFCYNLGVGAFQKSQIAKNLKSGAAITEEMFTVYSKARDQKTKQLVTLKGLIIRRKKEYKLFTK